MAEKFEVGKSYKSLHVVGACPFEVKFVGMYRVFVQFSDGSETTLHNADRSLYYEYHEPKVEKFVRCVMRCTGREPFVLMHPENAPGSDLLGKIEITLTDGKLSSVEIVE